MSEPCCRSHALWLTFEPYKLQRSLLNRTFPRHVRAQTGFVGRMTKAESEHATFRSFRNGVYHQNEDMEPHVGPVTK